MQGEEKLIRQIVRRGDRRAADTLVSAYYREIYAFLYRQCGETERAMDLTQEVFLSVLRALPGFDVKKASFRTWLYRIATNKLIDCYRSRGREQRFWESGAAELSAQAEAALAQAFERRELARQALEALAALPFEAQQILRLKLFAEHHFVEIAALLELPEGTVKSRYYAALRALRKELTEGGCDLSE